MLSVPLVAAATLVACHGSGDDALEKDAQATATFVVLGDKGVRVARAFTEEAQCPLIRINGEAPVRMEMRAAADTVPQRSMYSEYPKPLEFPVSTCETVLPADTHTAVINQHALPLGKAAPERIVVIGDTGCRVSQFSKNYQACNDPDRYPFAKIAQRAAQWKPDVVVHVGDYYYREDPCPDGNAECADSPWGGDYATWAKELFEPAAPLFNVAPWVVVRGNHETCKAGGQGWWRFLDPAPLQAGRDCKDPAHDDIGNFSDPYAVPMDANTQLIIADTANAPKEIQPGSLQFGKYQDLYLKFTALANQAKYNIALFHQPILGFIANDKNPAEPMGGNRAIQSVFQTFNPQLFPSNVQMLLSGDYHSWEQVSFATPHPTQFVVGFSGDQLEAPLPNNMSDLVAAGATPAPGAVVEHISRWPFADRFGYMTLEKSGAAQWNVTVWDQTGARINTCQIDGRRSKCDAK